MDELTDAELKRRAQAQRRQGDLNGAANTLEQAIDLVGGELADLHGMLGGTRREQGDLVSAAAAYDDGSRIESRYRARSSYNALNRLVTRILLAPGALSDPGVLRPERRLEFVDVPGALAELQARLERDVVGIRAGDMWAAGDLAVTAALNGDLDVATDAVRRFAACAPPPSGYSAYRRTLEALARLDTPRRAALERMAELLGGNGR